MNEMDEIVQEFLVESHENLDQLDSDLIALEQDPTSRDLLGSVFRTIHTIKGTSGFLAYGKLEAVTHVGENLLSRLRDGELALTPEITSALLQMVDAVRGLLGSIEADGTEGDPDHTALIETLTRLQVDRRPEQRASPEDLPVAGARRRPRPPKLGRGAGRGRRHDPRGGRRGGRGAAAGRRPPARRDPGRSRGRCSRPTSSTPWRRRPTRAARSPTAASASTSTCSTRS